MGEGDVVAVLALLERHGVTAWVDGGWGIDALCGQVTRDHADLDLVVLAPELGTVRAVLVGAGFATTVRDHLPTALAVADGGGREIDLHPVTPTADGGGDQALPDGGSFRYPPPVTGTIAGKAVDCVDPVTQVRAHLGYLPSPKDHHDMLLLHRRLGVDVPPAYRGGKP